MTKGVKAICDAMRMRPLDFHQGRYELQDKKTGLQYWTASGWGFYAVTGAYEFSFSFLDQFRFGSALKRWRSAWLVARMEQALETPSSHPGGGSGE